MKHLHHSSRQTDVGPVAFANLGLFIYGSKRISLRPELRYMIYINSELDVYGVKTKDIGVIANGFLLNLNFMWLITK